MYRVDISYFSLHSSSVRSQNYVREVIAIGQYTQYLPFKRTLAVTFVIFPVFCLFTLTSHAEISSIMFVNTACICEITMAIVDKCILILP